MHFSANRIGFWSARGVSISSLIGLISLVVYFAQKIKPLDIYTKELNSQIPDYLIQKEKEKNEKEKEIKKKEEKEKDYQWFTWRYKCTPMCVVGPPSSLFYYHYFSLLWFWLWLKPLAFV